MKERNKETKKQRKKKKFTHFSELGFPGYGRVRPGGSSMAAPSSHFSMLFEPLQGINCVVKLPHHMKAGVKFAHFVGGNQIIPWQGVYFFSNTI